MRNIYNNYTVGLQAPWMFRRVLLPLSKRRMRRFEGIVHPGAA